MTPATVGFVLILWANQNGAIWFQTPIVQTFATQDQCQTIGAHIKAESRQVASFECVPIQ